MPLEKKPNHVNSLSCQERAVSDSRRLSDSEEIISVACPEQKSSL